MAGFFCGARCFGIALRDPASRVQTPAKPAESMMASALAEAGGTRRRRCAAAQAAEYERNVALNKANQRPAWLGMARQVAPKSRLLHGSKGGPTALIPPPTKVRNEQRPRIAMFLIPSAPGERHQRAVPAPAVVSFCDR